MDEVLEKLESTIITPENADDQKSDFQELYKNWGRLGNQEERRKEILESQKTNRNDKIDAFRGILGIVKAVEEKNIFKPYNRVHYRPSIYVAGFHRTSTTYNNVLMLSEWMIEKPADFTENWYVVPCPKGVRMLVVADQGITKSYTKYGHFKSEYRTALPGGNPCEPVRGRCCVLDCFYSDENNIMYILDLLAWNNQPMTDGETEFRQYWLKSQLTELPQLTTINKKNKMLFQLLPMVPCNPESFNKFMSTHPQFEGNIPKLDGLLFYHKKAHYVSGETPLVGWLFPYMVQEVLGSEINIHPAYLSAKPPGYTDQATFIQAFEEKQEKRKPKGRRSRNVMDTSDSKETEPINQSTKELKTENASKAVQTELMEADDKSEPVDETSGPVPMTEAYDKTEPVDETIAPVPMTEADDKSESLDEISAPVPMTEADDKSKPVNETSAPVPMTTENEEKIEE